jgi:hypothetical protein
MRQHSKTPVVRQEQSAWEESGVREVPPDGDDPISVHEKKTLPPPMPDAEYVSSFVLSTPAPPPSDEAADVAVPGTLPPRGRRSASLAQLAGMHPSVAAFGPPQRRSSAPSGDDNTPLPPAPALPLLSVAASAHDHGDAHTSSHVSSPERVAVSTDRPTRRGAEAALADRGVVLQVQFSRSDLAALDLDHRVGFLLSLVDGCATLDEVLDMCPLAEEQVRAVLVELMCRGIVGVMAPRGSIRASRWGTQ